MLKKEMGNYIATFFSHYDALTFYSLLKERGTAAELAPVPRKVSASCGTCVTFVTDSITADSTVIDSLTALSDCDIEAVYMETPQGFSKVWTCDNGS